jgi:hypothetical protein
VQAYLGRVWLAPAAVRPGAWRGAAGTMAAAPAGS